MKYKQVIPILVFIICINLSYAQSLRIELNPETWQLKKYFAYSDPGTYIITTGATPFNLNVTIIAKYNDNSTQTTYPTIYGFANAPDPLKIKSFEVYNNNDLIFTKNVNYCNYNNLCEPCIVENCDLSENAMVCNDCSPYEDDMLCDPKENNICDPDCYIYDDIDCTSPIENETIEDYYEDLDLDKEPELKRENYTWVFIIVGIIFIIIILFYYIKKKKFITVSLLGILILVSIILILPNQINEITGMAVNYKKGDVLNTVVTKYYSPLVSDFSTWCSPTRGACMTTRDDILNYYRNTDYYSNADNCINVRRGGWCCIKMSDRGFYEEVKCEGSGFTEVNGELKAYRYFDIKETQASSPMHEPQIPAKTGETVACPQEFEKGTKFYLDYGESPWTGCYTCTDRGAAIKIDADGTVHLDLYVGAGVAALQEAGREASGQAKVYYGCEGREGSSEKSGEPGEQQTTTDIPEEIASGEKTGFYYLNPSFRVTEEFDMSIYGEISEDAKNLIKNVEECPDLLINCVNKNTPSTWNVNCNEVSRVCTFDVDTGYSVLIYNKTQYQETPVIVKFALKFPGNESYT